MNKDYIKKELRDYSKEDEARMNHIGRNGNDGKHYANETGDGRAIEAPRQTCDWDCDDLEVDVDYVEMNKEFVKANEPKQISVPVFDKDGKPQGTVEVWNKDCEANYEKGGFFFDATNSASQAYKALEHDKVKVSSPRFRCGTPTLQMEDEKGRVYPKKAISPKDIHVIDSEIVKSKIHDEFDYELTPASVEEDS